MTNIASPEHKANPFPFYARLRREEPVFRVTLPDKRTAWLITRYDDVVQTLRDGRFAKDMTSVMSQEQLSKQPWIPGFLKPLTRNMLDLDEPDHGRLRALVNKAFTPRRIDQMRDRIESLTLSILSEMRRKSTVDLIRDYAVPLPTTIIAQMLGVPTRDRLKFNRWSNAIVAANLSTWATLRMIPNAWMFLRYVRRLVQSRRGAPQDDLVSALVEAEEAGERLSEDELLAMVFLLLVAGHETTVNLIGNGMLALLDHPSELARLRENPALIEPAVEELLRYASPLETATERYAREDVTIAGATIRRGELVFAAIASANRDESQFPDADRLDITRDPNKHLSFGLGPHYCLGAPLARLEAQVAINTLLQGAGEFRLAVDREALRWRGGLVLRGLKALPVKVQGDGE